MKKISNTAAAPAPDEASSPSGQKSDASKARQRRMARETSGDPQPEKPKSAPRGPSKIDQVVGLLKRTSGATLAELIAVTGWLPHTTRAALTGLRKKGHTIEKTSCEGVTVYSIAAAA